MLQLLNDQTCDRCPMLAASRHQIVHGYGDPRSRIVFVGEAPGRHGADRTGTPFSGDKSGRALQRILIALGLADEVQPVDRPRLRCFITNAVRCCPPGNRAPTPSEVANCAPHLRFELDVIAPQLVIPVGRVALQVVGLRYLGYDPGPIRPLHAVPLRAGARVIVPLVHPSRISRLQTELFIDVMQELLEPRQVLVHESIGQESGRRYEAGRTHAAASSPFEHRNHDAVGARPDPALHSS